MVYVYENLDAYGDELYAAHLASLPEWRRTYALKYKQAEDRKRSVLTFVLLRKALADEFGAEITEFSYNRYGKPFLADKSLCFSLSHCKSAVACAVSDKEIGLDVETVRDFDKRVAERVLNENELNRLNSSDCPQETFFKLWTQKEAASKFEGAGLSLVLKKLELDAYLLHSEARKDFILSVCYGKKAASTASISIAPEIITVSNKDLERTST